MDENALSKAVIGAAIEVHKELGPGLFESAYHECLKHEFGLRDVTFESEVPVVVEYKGCVVSDAYRADFLVGNRIIIELKSVEHLKDIHKSQLLTYLRLSGCKPGLLINFNTALLKNGIHRVVNNL